MDKIKAYIKSLSEKETRDILKQLLEKEVTVDDVLELTEMD